MKGARLLVPLLVALQVALALPPPPAAEMGGVRDQEMTHDRSEIGSLPPCQEVNEGAAARIAAQLRADPAVAASFSRAMCTDGLAHGFACKHVDISAFVANADMGFGSEIADIWGWTDKETGREVAIVTGTEGTVFVDVTNETAPVVLGLFPLPSDSPQALVHDVNVMKDHAYIVAESASHGLQVLNLKTLPTVASVAGRPVSSLPKLVATGREYSIGQAHNVIVDEENSRLYVVGARSVCNGGGLLVYSVAANPGAPQVLGCGSTKYTHDAQCMTYRGPDANFLNRIVCFEFKISSIDFTDVTVLPGKVISSFVYPNIRYSHQGVVTPDWRYLVMGDEGDELFHDFAYSRTLFFDITSLTKPVHFGSYFSPQTSTDHNMYIKGNLLYQANYCSGFRILSLEQLSSRVVREVAFADVSVCDDENWNGAWSAYPYFQSGLVALSSIEQGLFLLRPRVQAIGEDSGPNRFVLPANEKQFSTLEPATTTRTTATSSPSPTTTTQPSGPSTSRVSCGDLGWGFHGGNTNACANSSPDGQCRKRALLEAARRACTGRGARLCTAVELRANVAKGSGCALDSKLVWSSTPCGGESTSRGVLQVLGSDALPRVDTCVTPGPAVFAGVRCCADPAPRSRLTCLQLGWLTANSQAAGCSAMTLNGTCSPKQTAASAKSLCDGLGARLCTAKELRDSTFWPKQQQQQSSQLCGNRSWFMWSSTPCGEGQFSVVQLTTLKPQTRCLKESVMARVRCCADA